MCEELNGRRRAAVEKGRLVRADLEEVTKDPIGRQERLLLGLLGENRDTEYGRRYGFETIASIRDFQEKVPVTEYGDYEPYIERKADLGERSLLTCAPPIWHSKTSGTVGVPKRAPCTQRPNEVFESCIVNYRAGLLSCELGERGASRAAR